MTLASIPEILAELKAGRMVVLVDEEDRENEGDLVLAADFVTPEAINFMAMHARGLVCLTLTEERCRQLALPLMVSQNRSGTGTAFTVSIEAAEGVTTGISAADRARTVRVAVAPDAKPADIVAARHDHLGDGRDGGRRAVGLGFAETAHRGASPSRVSRRACQAARSGAQISPPSRRPAGR